jgi:hypothetical protein
MVPLPAHEHRIIGASKFALVAELGRARFRWVPLPSVWCGRPGAEQVPELKERILNALQNNGEISFTFDKKLNVLKVSTGPR